LLVVGFFISWDHARVLYPSGMLLNLEEKTRIKKEIKNEKGKEIKKK